MGRVASGGREAILSAAMACAKLGSWEATSMEVVRQRAGVSNGSLFHHFPARRDLTAAVVSRGLAQHHDVMLGALGSDAGRSVREAVHRHIDWVSANPALARLLLATPLNVLRDSVADSALERNRTFFTSLSTWLKAHGWSGQPSLHTVLALWIGPAQEYCRNWAAEPDVWPLDLAADALAHGAWNALAPLIGQQNISVQED